MRISDNVTLNNAHMNKGWGTQRGWCTISKNNLHFITIINVQFWLVGSVKCVSMRFSLFQLSFFFISQCSWVHALNSFFFPSTFLLSLIQQLAWYRLQRKQWCNYAMDEDDVPYQPIQQHLVIHADPIHECISKRFTRAVGCLAFHPTIFCFFL